MCIYHIDTAVASSSQAQPPHHTTTTTITHPIITQVWTTKQPSSVLDINLKANVCSVEYNPRLSHELAVGSADHAVHVFDLRQPTRPLHYFSGKWFRLKEEWAVWWGGGEMVGKEGMPMITTCNVQIYNAHIYNVHVQCGTHTHTWYTPISPPNYTIGHRKAVSYVRYLNDTELASASIDGTLRLWNTHPQDQPHQLLHRFPHHTPLHDATTANATNMVRCYKGHANEKNFVGLTASDEFLACGSETNEVYVYFKALSAPIAKASFGGEEEVVGGNGDAGGAVHFISAVRWQPGTRMLVAANSQGLVKLMKLTSQ